jgi:hypothetical protein
MQRRSMSRARRWPGRLVELSDLIQSQPRRAWNWPFRHHPRLFPAAVAEFVEERISGRGDLEVLCAARARRRNRVQPLRRYAVVGDRRFEAFVYVGASASPTLRMCRFTASRSTGSWPSRKAP